ncbi:hypothetical protein PGT21_020198 [Puccinia graminis f. sp. tritici]|uniref:Uncharacterized protein n=1 Tax=Puccinia graminis f. sp. tritici TaxID=56615 RepID=A0A5B0MPY6_PUCGR|nr:hypothetical protein PGTUg99_005801 [Puccinia graminis f. sp. tritici]KAA1084179.1 hypothetical protein PGT21_020198 [Puccinia graminis f. sp. tritici]
MKSAGAGVRHLSSFSMSRKRHTTFFAPLVFSQVVMHFSSFQATPVILNEPAEQLLGWQPGDDLTKGLPPFESDDPSDWNLDAWEDGIGSQLAQWGKTDPIQAPHPQQTHDGQETTLLSPALPSFENLRSGAEDSLEAQTIFYSLGSDGGRLNTHYQPHPVEYQSLLELEVPNNLRARDKPEVIPFSGQTDKRYRPGLGSSERYQAGTSALAQRYCTSPFPGVVSKKTKNQVNFMKDEVDLIHGENAHRNEGYSKMPITSKLHILRPLDITNMQHPLLENFLEQFAQTYQSLSRCKNKQTCPDKFKFQDLPVGVYNGLVRPVNPRNGRFYDKEVFLIHIKHLISWTLLISMAALRRFDPKCSANHESSLHNQIIEWLLIETFFPTSSLPVFGLIQKPDFPRDQNTFGEVQKSILRFLSKPTSDIESCISTACLLLLEWFKKFNSPIFEFLIQVSKNSPFSFLSKDLLMKAIYTKMKFREEVKRSVETSFKIRDFLLLRSEDLPQEILPGNYSHEITGLKGTAEEILQKIEEFNESIPRNRDSTRIFQNLPILLFSNTKYQKDSSSPILESIKITNECLGSIRIAKLLARAKNLLLYLDFFHRLLSQHISERFALKRFDLLHKNEAEGGFMEWFKSELFNPKGSLPVFGKVKEVNLPLDRTKFGELQILVINYFSNPGSNRNLVQLSIFLNGCWYKNFHTRQWHLCFPEDKAFWEIMVHSFLGNYTKFVEFQKMHQIDKRKQNLPDSYNETRKRSKQ